MLCTPCRRLQTAASEGNIDGAESAISGMEAAGLAPGPRAFHVLVCAYLKGGDTAGALGVTGRATELGEQGAVGDCAASKRELRGVLMHGLPTIPGSEGGPVTHSSSSSIAGQRVLEGS